MTKIYGIYGFTHANIQIPVGSGKAYMQLEFTRGNPQGGPYYRPATFVCTDPVQQLMIEDSALFGKKIILYKQFGEEPAAVTEQETASAEKGEYTEYADVTTIEQARAVLKALGAKATVLANEDSMRSFMEKKKVSFPNLDI